MSMTKLTDAEVHELILARQASLTREEWQARLNEAAALFGLREDADEPEPLAEAGKYRPRGTRNSHGPARTQDVVLNGSHPKLAKASRKKSSPQSAQV
ncbi:MAG: hypothetical protein ACLQVD_16410 [Capsulimonadaceae bacterium]